MQQLLLKKSTSKISIRIAQKWFFPRLAIVKIEAEGAPKSGNSVAFDLDSLKDQRQF